MSWLRRKPKSEGRASLTAHPICALRAGMSRTEVIERIGPPPKSITSQQVRADLDAQPGIVTMYISDSDGEPEPEEYWLYENTPSGHDTQITLRSELLAEVAVKQLTAEGRYLGTVVRIDESGVAAADPYRETLRAEPL
jgi:hypothetical protein